MPKARPGLLTETNQKAQMMCAKTGLRVVAVLRDAITTTNYYIQYYVVSFQIAALYAEGDWSFYCS